MRRRIISSRRWNQPKLRVAGPKSSIRIDQLINKAVTPIIAEISNSGSFSDYNLPHEIQMAIEESGYSNPTPIQAGVIPLVQEERDVIGIANTGTGKTAAFLVPLIQKRMNNPHEKILIVAPTRELAVQIDQELRRLSKFTPNKSVVCIGGLSMGQQISGLKGKYSFVIGTPGRIKDLSNRNELDLSQFKTFVLDEVDRMLDMGFIHDVKYMLSKLPKDKQMLVFSATLSNEISTLLDGFLINPAKISVKTQETSGNVAQDIIKVQSLEHKKQMLKDLLESEEVQKAIIFGRTKRGVNKLFLQLAKQGFRVEAIHGNKSQGARQKAINAFKQQRVNILIATDVAARGLDIPDVSHVINYDLPQTYEDYVHRIGRTGRVGKKGIALTFV